MTTVLSILAQTTQPAGLAQKLLENVGSLLSFYGVTAGFLLTLYGLYTKDAELRVSRRELSTVLNLVIVALIVQCFVWFGVRIAGLEGAGLVAASLLGLLVYLVALGFFFMRVSVLSMLRVEKLRDLSFLRSLKHLPGIREIRHRYRKTDRYVTDPEQRPTSLRYAVLQKLTEGRLQLPEKRGVSCVLVYETSAEWLEWLSLLVKEHVELGETMTLVLCRHHPAHVLDRLETVFEDRPKLRRSIYVVDAFTQPFGGDDDIFPSRLKEKVSDGYSIASAGSVAGIHSGAASAFNHFKEHGGKRAPSTVIYDGILVAQYYDMESQLSRFLIHMTAAEREYGMITVLGEPMRENGSPALATLHAVADHTRILKRVNNQFRYESYVPRR